MIVKLFYIYLQQIYFTLTNNKAMKKLFYFASVAFMSMLFLTSCEGLGDDDLNDDDSNGGGANGGDENVEDLTTDDLSGDTGQIKSISYKYDDCDSDSDVITYSYDSKGRVTAFIYTSTWESEQDEVYYTSPASTRTSTQETKAKVSPFSRMKSRKSSAAATRSSDSDSATTVIYTETANITFEYSSNAIKAELYYVGYTDGVQDEEESSTYNMTLDSDGYITQIVFEGEGEGEAVSSGSYDSELGEYVYTVIPYTYVSKSTETFEYSDKYIKTYTYKHEGTDTYEDGSTDDYEYLQKEVYTHTSGNLTSFIESYYDDYNDLYVDENTKDITYGSDLNNLSLDLASYFQYAEYSESLLLMHTGLYGKSSTNLPTNLDSEWYGNNDMDRYKFEYNYSSGKLTSVDVYYYYTGSSASDYEYGYTLEIEYY